MKSVEELLKNWCTEREKKIQIKIFKSEEADEVGNGNSNNFLVNLILYQLILKAKSRVKKTIKNLFQWENYADKYIVRLLK